MLVFKNFIFEIRLEIDGSQKPFVENYHLNQSEANLRFGLRQNLEFSANTPRTALIGQDFQM